MNHLPGAVPKLNAMYEEYGCNKGALVFIMDGVNIYHDDMEHKYKHSPFLLIIGGIDSEIDMPHLKEIFARHQIFIQ